MGEPVGWLPSTGDLCQTLRRSQMEVALQQLKTTSLDENSPVEVLGGIYCNRDRLTSEILWGEGWPIADRQLTNTWPAFRLEVIYLKGCLLTSQYYFDVA